MQGDICVNTRVVGTWYVRRLTPAPSMPIPADWVSEYEFRVTIHDIVRAGKLRHRYGDGVARLASLVLAEHTKSRAKPLTLTPQQLEILQHMADGMSNEKIATEMFMGVDTLKGHIRNIFAKMHVTNRTHAVALGFRNEWLR